MKPLVYLAAPYTHPDPVANTHRVIQIATQLVDEGLVTPVVPHLTMLWHLVEPRPISYWYAYDLEILAHCDIVLRLDGASTGADQEVVEAERLGLPVAVSIADLYELVVTR